MEEREFIAGSRESWERLDAATGEAAGQGIAKLGPDVLKRMHEDYRRTAADLAYAQTHYPGSRTTAYLNSLVARAHAGLYGAAPRRLAAAWAFLASGYPRLVRTHAGPVLLAAALLFGGVLLGFLLAYTNWPLARTFVPEALREGVGDRLERGSAADGLVTDLAPLLSAGITANNVQVALVAFAGGMTAGVLTGWSMLQNGLLLGALAGAASKAGEAFAFWALIVPHGSLELPAIVLAGGSGLMIARSILFPGDLPRASSLRRGASEAVRVVLGSLPLFVLAGLVEGFFTPSAVDPVWKLLVGAALTGAFVAYIALAGRDEAPARG